MSEIGTLLRLQDGSKAWYDGPWSEYVEGWVAADIQGKEGHVNTDHVVWASPSKRPWRVQVDGRVIFGVLGAE